MVQYIDSRFTKKKGGGAGIIQNISTFVLRWSIKPQNISPCIHQHWSSYQIFLKEVVSQDQLKILIGPLGYYIDPFDCIGNHSNLAEICFIVELVTCLVLCGILISKTLILFSCLNDLKLFGIVSLFSDSQNDVKNCTITYPFSGSKR